MQERIFNMISKCILKIFQIRIESYLKLFISIYFFYFHLFLSILNPILYINYLEIAAKNNPTVLQRFSEYQAALQKIPQVGSLPDPELSAGVFLSPMELVSGNQVADLRLMQMFPWFGVLKICKR